MSDETIKQINTVTAMTAFLASKQKRCQVLNIEFQRCIVF